MLTINKGRKIHFELDGNPDGQRLVLLNSLGTSLRSWDDVVRLLLDDYHILRIDKSGHGQSDPHSGPRQIEGNSADVLAVMDAVEWDCASICGVSIGGMTAIDMAIHHPQRLEKIILSNTSSFVNSEHLAERSALIRNFGIAFVAAQVVGRFFIDQSAIMSNDRYLKAVKDFLACDDASYIAWCEAIVLMDFRPKLHEINHETLVMTGQYDKATPAHMGQHLHQSIQGSVLIDLPYGHIPYLDDPGQYAEVLDEFLS